MPPLPLSSSEVHGALFREGAYLHHTFREILSPCSTKPLKNWGICSKVHSCTVDQEIPWSVMPTVIIHVFILCNVRFILILPYIFLHRLSGLFSWEVSRPKFCSHILFRIREHQSKLIFHVCPSRIHCLSSFQ